MNKYSEIFDSNDDVLCHKINKTETEAENNKENSTKNVSQRKHINEQHKELAPLVDQSWHECVMSPLKKTCCCTQFQVSNLKYEANGNAAPPQFVEVEFKCKRKRLFRNITKLPIHLYDLVVVEVENGMDLGSVIATDKEAMEKLTSTYKGQEPDLSVIRLANQEDMMAYQKNTFDEITATQKTRELVKHFKLDMKVTAAEWQFDHQRLTVFFTAPVRIDFRELVKELARSFKTRIELRQISTREEAKRIGGMGPCGRHLCCTSFENEFSHITLDHARVQQLSNNVAKLSGYCGRLKCCLMFEFDNYSKAFEKYPEMTSLIDLPEGTARILKVDIFKDILYLYVEKNNTYKTIQYSELEELKKNGKVRAAPREVLEKIRKSEQNNEDLAELAKLEDPF